MLDITQIEAAHAKVKSGADFPNYIQDLKLLGIKNYSTFVNDGHTVFFTDENKSITSKRKYARLRVANISDKERFKHYLKNHQRGQTDYPTFCKQSAETGVEKWVVTIEDMTCIYYDKNNNNMLEETIPTS